MTFHFIGYFPKRIERATEAMGLPGVSQHWRPFAANDRCLFATVDEAITAARAFAAGQWEPGPYCVVEVLAGSGVV